MDLSDFRKQYTKGQLLESEAPSNPFELFGHWFDEVQSYGKEQETNAMTLSTHLSEGGIASRVVLLKEVRDDGFVFYTLPKKWQANSVIMCDRLPFGAVVIGIEHKAVITYFF